MDVRERILAACIGVLVTFGVVAVVVHEDATPVAGADGPATTTDPRHDDGTATTDRSSTTAVDAAAGSTSSTAGAATTATTARGATTTTTRPAGTTTTTARAATTTGPQAPATTAAPAGAADLGVYTRVADAGDGTRRLRVLVDNAGPRAGGPLELAVQPGSAIQLTIGSASAGLSCSGTSAGPITCEQADSPMGGRILDVTFVVTGTSGGCPQSQSAFTVAVQVGVADDPAPANNSATRSVCVVD